MREIRARLVVAADGRDSKVATLAGATPETRPNNRFIYFAHYRDLRLASGKKSQMWLLEPDVAYAFPNDDGVTLLTCMPAREKLPAFKEDLEGSFARFFEGLPEGPHLAGAERVSKIMGATNLVNRSRPAAADGLAFIGDAALWSDPLWGIGCGWAFQSAEWLADEVGAVLANGADLEGALARYRDKHRKKLSGHQRIRRPGEDEMTTEAYGANTPTYLMGRSEAETRRLMAQHRLYGPFTRRLLEDAGIEEGMKVLDVGSGAGDVALLAAELVGPPRAA